MLGLDLDGDGIVGPLVGQTQHIPVKGRTEQQGLPIALVRRTADDLLHLGDETHVEHAIGLVDHQNLHHIQMEVPAPAEIEQPSRRRDDDIDHIVLDLFHLPVVVDATDEHGDVEIGIFG